MRNWILACVLMGLAVLALGWHVVMLVRATPIPVPIPPSLGPHPCGAQPGLHLCPSLRRVVLR